MHFVGKTDHIGRISTLDLDRERTSRDFPTFEASGKFQNNPRGDTGDGEFQFDYALIGGYFLRKNILTPTMAGGLCKDPKL